MSMLNLDSIKAAEIKKEKVSLKEIAIIGISVGLPKAENLDELWDIFVNGEDLVGEVPEGRKTDLINYLNYLGLKDELLPCGYLEEIDKFDYNFFKLSYRKACLMDPTQRLFLQSAWSAIEDAGYNRNNIAGSKTGIYIGLSELGKKSYLEMNTNTTKDSVIDAITGNTPSLMPTHLAHTFDMRGASMVIDTACSSSMVALIQACQSLRNGTNSMAVVSSVRTYCLPIDNGIKLGMESSDGKTRTFDIKADGTGIAEACISLMIKPLAHAERDKDNIYAVIKGFAINQDGNSVGLTAPNLGAQVDVLKEAWDDAGINPEKIKYIEAHGTATKLGDPIEVSALTDAFSKYTKRKQFCGIGSAKSNFGHAYDASGLVSIAKVILVLKNKQIPPTIHFDVPNPKIDFVTSPFFVADKNRQLEGNGEILCGVSSFGFSGTNCHMILSNYDKQIKQDGGDQQYPFVMSAKTLGSLFALVQKYYYFGLNHNQIDIGNLCYTAANKDRYDFRLAFIVNNYHEFQYRIEQLLLNFDDCVKSADYYVSSNISESDHIVILGESELCNQYIAGDQFNWETFYRHRRFQTISLPTYAFEKHKCWLKIPKGIIKPLGISTATKDIQATTEPLEISVIGRQQNQYTDYELTVAHTFAEALGCQEININDNYFDLGGDSISALPICTKLAEKYDLDVKVSDIFKHPVIKDFAQLIQHEVRNGESNRELDVHISKAKEEELYPASSAQKRMYIAQVSYPDSLFNNITRILHVDGELDLNKIKTVLHKLIDRHTVLRTSFSLVDGELYQQINSADLSLEIIECENESDFNQLLKGFIRPFNLHQSPLFRMMIVRLAADRFKIVFDFHHSITDGTSNAIFAGELFELYNSKQLEPLKIQYADYAVWQKNLLTSGILNNQKEYWKKMLHANLPHVVLKNRELTTAINPFSASVYLDKIDYYDLKKFVAQSNTTMFNCLLTAIFIVFSDFTKENDLLIGTPTTGRHYPGVSKTLGIFINTLVIRIELSKDKTFTQLLEIVSAQMLQAFEHQDYQYDELIKELDLSGEESLFNVLFAYQNMAFPDIAMDGLQVKNEIINHCQSQNDLTLEAMPFEDYIEFKYIYRDLAFSTEDISILSENLRLILANVNQFKDLPIEDLNLKAGITEISDQPIAMDFEF